MAARHELQGGVLRAPLSGGARSLEDRGDAEGPAREAGAAGGAAGEHSSVVGLCVQVQLVGGVGGPELVLLHETARHYAVKQRPLFWGLHERFQQFCGELQSEGAAVGGQREARAFRVAAALQASAEETSGLAEVCQVAERAHSGQGLWEKHVDAAGAHGMQLAGTLRPARGARPARARARGPGGADAKEHHDLRPRAVYSSQPKSQGQPEREGGGAHL